MVRVGLIARMDDTGLGNQTRNLYKMLQPDKTMVINSRSFKSNVTQHPDWYNNDPHAYIVDGFPTLSHVRVFCKDIDVLLGCEIFYALAAPTVARQLNVATALQYNWEFLDYLNNNTIDKPDIFISPSYWHLNDMTTVTDNFVYLPPPLDETDFIDTQRYNLNSKSEKLKLLHVVGKPAIADRNGTDALLAAMRQVRSDNVELVIRSQEPLGPIATDNRVKFEHRNLKNVSALYDYTDVMILPRRYGGLSLPMNEALMSGVIPIMTDIEPNNKILPKEWLVESTLGQPIQTRSLIDTYDVNITKLAEKIDELAELDKEQLKSQKLQAIKLAQDNFGFGTLKPKYIELFESLVND